LRARGPPYHRVSTVPDRQQIRADEHSKRRNLQ
jgi:hypothetical protein